MIDSLYIAWRYLLFNRGRSIVLIISVTIIVSLPLALQVLLAESERQLRARAGQTPLLLGARGSALDLVMRSLYFSQDAPTRLIDMRAVAGIEDTGLAAVIPLYVRFRARDFSIVGTSLDYFEFRGLQLAAGRILGVLGECVIGAEVARHLNLGPGDSLLSSPENLFDLAGIYPLQMKVVGVLERSHSADDLAVLVDIRTAWVIQGLGHGHQDLGQTQDSTVILERNQNRVTANAKLLHYNEITEDNLDSFHFHGDGIEYPLSAVIALPRDQKSAALLRGRFLDDKRYQLSRPDDVVDGLLQNIFRIKSIIDATILIVGSATLLTMVLVFTLSLRLRRDELDTIYRIGCSRMTMVRLLSAEILIILISSAVLGVLLLGLVQINSDQLVRSLVLR